MEKIVIELTPFSALTVLTLLEVQAKRMKRGNAIQGAISEFTNEVINKVSDSQIDMAFVELEIKQALKEL